MPKGYAVYDSQKNQLQVVRPNETTKRYINCTNFRPNQDQVFGVEVHGDEIWLLVGPLSNQRPNRKIIYRFSSLSGGGSAGI